MAEKTINNPSLLPSDLAFELSGNIITAISGHPIAGSGSGTVSDLVYYRVEDRIRQVWKVKLEFSPDMNNEFSEDEFTYFIDTETGEIVGGE